MENKNDSLNIHSFTVTSTSEIRSFIEKVSKLDLHHSVVHITSFIHNTVLVQTLKKELLKVLPDTRLALVKHDDKATTNINIFDVVTIQESDNLQDKILDAVYSEYVSKHEHNEKFRSQLYNKYFIDNLTNLPNVYQLRKDMLQHEEYGLVSIKIDNFLTINNFYGFVVGDYVIEEVSKFLKKTITDSTIYRLSGSEFGFVLEENMSFYDLKLFLSDLYENMKSYSVLYQDNRIFIDFTMASSSSLDRENVFSKVSMALNYAKNIGVPFWIYEDRMNFENDYERNIKLSQVVRDAVEDSRIVPYFQAIVDNKTSKIVKYECLARLIEKNGNVLSPVLFIPIAKKIKLYNKITIQMVEKSFEAFKDSDLEFNINLSIEDIMNSEIFHYILDKLKHSPSASRVTFELLESESVKDFNKVSKFITEIKRFGAKIAIDDFGSGYSNFSHLIKIRAHYIKIDGSLIKHIDVDKSSLIVVETIVAFAKKLGIKTVAEYVHSSVVMKKVQELGIDYSQGFYIDEPSIEHVKEFML